MQKIVTHNDLFLLPQNNTNYIPKDIGELSQISSYKKNQAQEAIRWLLSKAPHSVDEIAEHFEISPELAKALLKDTTRDN
jgi:hypothetical protein